MAPLDDSDAVTVAAESKEKKADEKLKKLKKSEKELKEESMSEEDKELKERLETCVSTVTNDKNEADVTIPIRLTALDVIVNELRTATASMTSVPKPLKFLRPHFPSLRTLYLSLEQKGTCNSQLMSQYGNYPVVEMILPGLLIVIANTATISASLALNSRYSLSIDDRSFCSKDK